MHPFTPEHPKSHHPNGKASSIGTKGREPQRKQLKMRLCPEVSQNQQMSKIMQIF